MRRFSAHLDEVGETYFEHAGHAASFSIAMIKGGLACLVHAALPFLFERTGSDIIRDLHDQMVENRSALTTRKKTTGHRSARPSPAFIAFDPSI